jgi:hypothetical protein
VYRSISRPVTVCPGRTVPLCAEAQAGVLLLAMVALYLCVPKHKQACSLTRSVANCLTRLEQPRSAVQAHGTGPYNDARGDGKNCHRTLSTRDNVGDGNMKSRKLEVHKCMGGLHGLQCGGKRRFKFPSELRADRSEFGAPRSGGGGY